MVRLVLLVLLMALTMAGCGGSKTGETPLPDACEGVGRVTVAHDKTGDVSANVALPKPPAPPAGLDLVRVRLVRSATKLCAVFESEAPPPATAVFQIGLREAGKGDSGGSVAISAVLHEGRRYVQVEYPGADARPDRGLIAGDIRIRANQVSLVTDTRTLPAWTPPASGSEWEASTLGLGNQPNLQYVDCAPEHTQHIAYPGGQVVQFANGRGSC